jgi:hypothetical protein
MHPSDLPRERAKLRLTIRIGMWPPTLLLAKGVDLPAEATHMVPNLPESRDRSIGLSFGENESPTDNLQVSGFDLDSFPVAGQGGPPNLTLKVSVSAKQLLCIAVLEPLSLQYRSIGFVNIGDVQAPPTLPPPPAGPLVLHIGEILADFFNEAFAKRRAPQVPRRGKDIACDLAISFEEALEGVQKHVEVCRAATCPECAGSGSRPGTSAQECHRCQGSGTERVERQTERGMILSAGTCAPCNGTGRIITDPCPACQGRARIDVARPVSVNVPMGVDSDAQICMLDQGEPSQTGGQSGNLYVRVTVAEHPIFTRLGRQIAIRLPVKSSFARRGGQLQVPGLEAGSYFLLRIPPNTRDGTEFPVFHHASYTLTATVTTYNPYDPIALLKNRRRLQAIADALMAREYEVTT